MVLDGKEYDFAVDRPSVIIDAGANIGLASIWFASKFPEARILAIEPEKSNYELLVRNVEPLHHVTPKFMLLCGPTAGLSRLRTLVARVHGRSDPGIG